MKIKKIHLFDFLSLSLILSFLLGFFLSENSAGGGEGDFDHILNNYKLIFDNSFTDIDWSKYRDSRFPLDYFIFKLYLPANEDYWKYNIFLISAITPLVLFYVLKKKNQNYEDPTINSNYLLFIALFLYISPYFRTSSFWMLRENVGYLFWIISIFFFLKLKTNSYYKINLVFCFLFSYMAFYSSQNLFIISLTNFFLLFNYQKFFSSNNFYLILINIIFFSPLVIFFEFFSNAIQYIEIEEINRITFSFYKIVDLYGVILIYIFPFFLIYFGLKEIINLIKKEFIIILIFLFCFSFIFWNYPNEDLLSGGAIRKVFNMLISNEILFKILYLPICGLSMLISFYFAVKKEKTLLFLLLPYTIFYTFINYIFQEYLDPVFILFLILYSKNFIYLIKDKIIYLFIYFLTFYLSAFTYYEFYCTLCE
tara:strand:- start:1586 stop:2857 length:1272 start_codon:yes stop_codon:yes gene_type:complete